MHGPEVPNVQSPQSRFDGNEAPVVDAVVDGLVTHVVAVGALVRFRGAHPSAAVDGRVCHAEARVFIDQARPVRAKLALMAVHNHR